ncbi:hypothetical protein SVAN01_10844 [Stagonosporopsis vannaccii]|nr:hypothetical protein SVAN01_10844 [Stagonosporopsis vannaccii]
MAIPFLKKKVEVQEAFKQAGIPLTVVLISNLAEFMLGSMRVYACLLIFSFQVMICGISVSWVLIRRKIGFFILVMQVSRKHPCDTSPDYCLRPWTRLAVE